MEFVKVGKNYLIKNSNGKIVSEREMLELENRELILEDIKSSGCAGTITKKISKNKKRIKEIMKEEKDFIPVETYDTALQEKEVANDNNKKTSKSI